MINYCRATLWNTKRGQVQCSGRANRWLIPIDWSSTVARLGLDAEYRRDETRIGNVAWMLIKDFCLWCDLLHLVGDTGWHRRRRRKRVNSVHILSLLLWTTFLVLQFCLANNQQDQIHHSFQLLVAQHTANVQKTRCDNINYAHNRLVSVYPYKSTTHQLLWSSDSGSYKVPPLL